MCWVCQRFDDDFCKCMVRSSVKLKLYFYDSIEQKVLNILFAIIKFVYVFSKCVPIYKDYIFKYIFVNSF
jgi:hypothetical protein